MGRDHLGVPEVDEVILLKCHLKKLVDRITKHMGHMAGLVMGVCNFSVFEIFDKS
jgi:hypothetical protein